MTDLETAVRDALRSRAESVQPLETRLRARRRRPVVAPWLAAAAVVVALVAAGVVAVVGHNGDQHSRPGSRATAIVGYRWVVTEIDGKGAQVVVPRKLGVFLGFGHDGFLLGDDSVNAISGHYRIEGDGYRARDVASTAAGYIGHDPAVLGAQFALAEATSDGRSIGAEVDGDRLTLNTRSYVLHLLRAGRQPDEGTPSGTTPPP